MVISFDIRSIETSEAKLTQTCEICFSAFKSKKLQHTCSKECSSIRLEAKKEPLASFQCANCQKFFLRKSSLVKNPEKVFCSKTCYRKRNIESFEKKAICDFCNREYPFTTTYRKFCSSQCKSEASREKLVQAGIAIIVNCAYCNKEIRRSKSQIENFKNSYCSREHRSKAKEKTVESRECVACGKTFQARIKSKTKACSHQHGVWAKNVDLLPLRLAFEKGRDQFLTALKNETFELSEKKCWHPTWTTDPYPYMSLPGIKGSQLHRIVLTVSEGPSEDNLDQAHHTCGNARCVNPNHLQWLSPHANVAEMLERKKYIDKIRKLENELRKVDPDSVLLK